MPYPVTPSTGYASQGAATTLIWGTDGIAASTQWAAYVVLRFNQRVKKEDIPITNGTGIETGRVQLFHGNVWEITLRDDVNMTPPLYAAQVTIKDAAGLLGTVGLNYTARVLDSGWSTGPKQAAERTITVEKLALVD